MKFFSIITIIFINCITGMNAQNITDPKAKIEAAYTSYQNFYSDRKCCNCQNSAGLEEVKNRINLLISEFNQAGYFPGFNEVGKESANRYLELLLESNNEVSINTAMELMYPKVLEKNADPLQYATYIDKKSYSETKLQVYGTIVKAENICLPPGKIKFTVMPIKDSKDVEARRASIGLTSIDEMVENYRKRIIGK